MAVVVADASVVVKALIRDDNWEENADRARQLWSAVTRNRIQLQQPPHWLAEVAAVLSRISPSTAAADVRDLHEMTIMTIQNIESYKRAVELSITLEHHLFYTLYHAIALDVDDAELVTADERYYNKARQLGQITRLGEYDPNHVD